MYIVNVEGFIADNDRYLMVIRSDREEHAPGTLSVPGGKVETAGFAAAILEATLRREIMEEVGVEVEAEMTYIESKLFTIDNGVAVVDIVFLCRYRSGTPTALDPAEVAALQWMRAADVLAHPKLPPWTRDSLLLVEAARQRSS